MSDKKILIVDDEVGIRELLSEILFDEGYQVHLAENVAQARLFRSTNEPDLVLLDIWMPDVDGITLLKEWREQELLTMPVIMMSGHGTLETAVEATRIGAVDFLEKPISLQKLLSTITKTLKESEQQAHYLADIAHKSALNNGTQEIDGEASAQPLVNLHLPLDLPLREARDYFDALYLDHHLQIESGNVAKVAEKVGLERTHLYRKLKQLGIKYTKK